MFRGFPHNCIRTSKCATPAARTPLQRRLAAWRRCNAPATTAVQRVPKHRHHTNSHHRAGNCIDTTVAWLVIKQFVPHWPALMLLAVGNWLLHCCIAALTQRPAGGWGFWICLLIEFRSTYTHVHLLQQICTYACISVCVCVRGCKVHCMSATCTATLGTFFTFSTVVRHLPNIYWQLLVQHLSMHAMVPSGTCK